MSERPLDPHDDERRVAEKLAVRFEREDVGPLVILRAAIGLILMTVVVAVLAVWLLEFLRDRETAGDPPRPSIFYPPGERQVEGVQLQTTPLADLDTRRAEERAILNSYGWVDEAAGVVHIPIEHAMRLYLARQAGSAAGAGTDVGAASRVPTDAAPVPVPLTGATPLPSPDPSPAASDAPASHAPAPTGGHR